MPQQPSVPSESSNSSRSVNFADDWCDNRGGKKLLAETRSFDIPQTMCWSFTYDLDFGDNTRPWKSTRESNERHRSSKPDGMRFDSTEELSEWLAGHRSNKGVLGHGL